MTKMYSQKIFNNNSCYISGLHRSGKSLLLAILPSLKNIDIVNKDPVLSLIPSLYRSGEIKSQVATYLIRYIQSNINYSNHLGRKLNLRKLDETSIFNLIDSQEHIDKIYLKKKKDLHNVNSNKVSFYDIHNALLDIEIWRKSNEKFKLINIERSPIDIIYSWYLNGFGNHKPSPINQLLVYKHKNKLVPNYAINWKNEYSKLNEMDRIIKIVSIHILESEKNFFKNKKKDMLRISYEDLLLNPLKYLIKIKKFLNLKSSIFFDRYRKKIDLSKIKTEKERKKKIEFIKKKSSKVYLKKLLKLELDYNNCKYNKIYS